MVHYTQSWAPVGPKPTAYIAINKNRLKVYKSTEKIEPSQCFITQDVYLKDKQEFQVEVFNPTQKVLLAEFYINGTRMQGGGLVLRPGERVFLDRYLSESKKLLFSTYEVSGSSAEVAKAIENNGLIEVKFYEEYEKPESHAYYSNTITLNNPIYTPGTGTPINNVFTTNTCNAASSTGNLTYTTGIDLGSQIKSFSSDVTYSAASGEISMNCIPDMEMSKKRTRSMSKELKSIETGRIEKGSNSKQTFEYVDKSFNCWSFHQVSLHLMPISQKKESSDSVNKRKYCSECGSKASSATAKFCSHCGSKL